MAPFARGNRKEGSTTSNGQGAPAATGGYKRLRETIEMVDTVLQMGASVFHVFVRIIGPVFICIAIGLISFCTYTYFGYVLPSMAETVGFPGQILITAVGIHLLFNILFNYACAVCKNAGTPPEHEQAVALAAEKGERAPRKCEKCSRAKPVRTHHCSVCRRCVLKMDHHCPWINNCVGWANYRNFCLFMLYLAMGCGYVMLVYGPFMFDIPEAAHGVQYHLGLLQEDDYRQWLRQNKVNSRRRSIGNDAQYFIVFSVMIAMSIFIALSILGSFHAYLVLTNQTTIEFQLNMLRRRDARKREDGIAYRNVYDMGRTRNFQQVFGPHRFWGCSWMFPMCSKGPEGDGMEFPSSSRS